MDCLKCHERVVELDKLFFFCKDEKTVSLSIKPEIKQIIYSKKVLLEVREGPKDVRIKCGQCSANLGRSLPFGPGGAFYIAFGCDKVKLGGRSFGKKGRWTKLHTEFKAIETRDMSNFYNILKVEETLEKKSFDKIDPTINFPSLNNLQDFEWFSVCLDKIPRKYQKEAFIEVLQRNLVVVLKTGAGKTLVASMFLARMCSLNPNKMGLMIVDRIPLVFQQGDAIHIDTKLRVARICGENRTAYKIDQLNNNNFDVLVVTAGAFYEMVLKKEIDVNVFCAVVLDECHHTTGGHRYVDVLQMFTKKNLQYQPRILGLTASPISGRTSIQCENRLETFLKSFPNAKIFYPPLPKQVMRIEEISIKRTPSQENFIGCVYQEFMKHCNKISISLKVKDITPLKCNLLNAYVVVGDLRALDNEYCETHPELPSMVKDALLLLESMQFCHIMGTEYGFKKLQGSPFVNLFCIGFHMEISNRLQELLTLIKRMKPESKILVFVATRSIARVLTERLQTEFPNLNPDKMVGHGGHDGMDWEFDQKAKIQKFSHGKCNVLVCTSVLEEGLDVASCDLVVRFNGVSSLIKFIQSRGRARKEGSRFIVYQSEEEVSRHRDLQLQEEMLKTVLRQRQNACALFTEMSKEIMKRIEDEMSQDQHPNSLKDKSFQVLSESVEYDLSFVIYCDPVTGIAPNQIKEKLQEVLEECTEFTLSRLVLLSEDKKIYSLPKNIFSSESLVFLVNVKCNRRNSTPQETYRAFCSVFPSCIQISETKLFIWTKDKHPKSPYEGSDHLIMKSFEIGYFEDKATFVSCFIHNEAPSDIQFNKEKRISITKDFDTFDTFDTSTLEFSIPKTSIQSFGLVSVKPNEVTLTFSLRHPPEVIYHYSIDREMRLSVECDKESITAFSRFPVLMLTFHRADIDSLISILDHMFPVPFFNVSLQRKENKSSSTRDFVAGPNFLDASMWAVRCLEDSRALCLPATIRTNLANAIMSRTDSSERDLVQSVIEKCCFDDRLPFFYGFERAFNETYNALASIPKERRHFLKQVVPKGHHLIKRVYITPLRIVLLPAVPVASNRLLRMLVNTKFQLVILTFRDEDFSKVQSKHLLSRCRRVVAEGVELNGIHYNFLCSTGSQLREHKGYFIAADYEQVLSIRKQIIPNPEEFTSAAKYFSRLGIYGTADKIVGKIDFSSQCREVADLKASNGDLVTDGAGKISLEWAAKIARQLNLGDNIPSAFQIRYSGVKGIVVACKNGDRELENKQFAFRKSMIKFKNQDKELCVSSSSRLLELSLNREIITLLCSIPTEWGLDNVLLNYQENALSRFSDIFIEQSLALNEMRNFMDSQKIDQLQDSKMEVIDDKYWISILQGIYRLRTREIRTRTSIPLDISTQGCLVMGVPDPYGVLDEGEVFVQLKPEKGDTKILEGRLLIFRNPCLHPGDCPTVTGVVHEELKHLFNVIVFPVKGRNSLPATCSGGDLDGDLYAVIWDPNLIPPEYYGYPACNYDELAVSHHNIQPVDVTSQDKLADFFKQFMENDCLGRVATKHIAVCDILEKGARDPLAVQLAKAQSQAVDFPKNGIVPEVPKKLFKEEEFMQYPDFMDKPSNQYLSNKILGVLYRRCRSLAYNFDVGMSGSPNVLLNMNLWLQGHEDFLDDAGKVYVSYAYDMEMLMRKFELKAEADIILGQATFTWSKHLEADKGKASKSIEASYGCLVEKYRNIFYSDVTNKDDIQMKASAWYRIVNDPEIKINGRKRNAKIFLSFPWIVSDVLCEMRKGKAGEKISRRLVNIGESALNLFKKNSRQLLMTITEKLKKGKAIEEAIDAFSKRAGMKRNGFLVEAYGSTSMYLCEDDSDIDVCVLVQDQNKVFEMKTIVTDPYEFKNLDPVLQQKHFLQTVVSRAVDSIASKKREVLGTKVPIVKCSFQDGDKEIQCDISMNEIGYRKTLYIRYLYHKDPLYLPLFWILVRWARLSGLIRSTACSDKRMDSAEFYALIIHVLRTPTMKNMKIQKPTRWSGIKYVYSQLEKFDLESFYELGKLIFKFFQQASLLEGNIEMMWPAPNIPKVTLDRSQVEDIKNLAAKALHALSATRDVNAMLNYFLITAKDKNTIRKTLPLNVSYAIGKAQSFHAARLSELTGALVTLEVKEGRNNLVLQGEGSRMAIENLQNELKKLISDNKALTLGRLPQKTSRYFMEGSSIFLARNNTSSAATLEFENGYGAYELHHHAHQRSAVHVKNPICQGDWKENAIESLRCHLLKQFQRFPIESTDMLKTLEVTIRFGCFYLVDIDSHLPDSQRSIPIEELQFSVEKGRRSRKAWMRGEFRASSQQQPGAVAGPR